MSVEIAPLGDLAVRVSFGNEITESIHQKVQQFLLDIEEKKIKGIVEYVPTYTTLTIYYNPRKISYDQLVEKIERTMANSNSSSPNKQWVYEIPVYYGGETGPDLSYVAEYHRMSEQEVIEIHTSNEYLIYMIGFVPGFPYLGGLSKEISVPRLQHPRSKVAAGSVGIGGDQTGIYPAEVPSGWRIIGITPVSLFQIEKSPPALLSAGNYVKFYSVDCSEYLSIKKFKNFQVKRREYKSDRS